jgi:hypothetical protein|tara:strand:+ start:55 stop:204 length:150 start_codon:yes stop_codon:yes gene_type:complete
MYEVIGTYQNCSPEVLDEAHTKEYALMLMREYKVAFGEGWKIYIKKVRQ